MTRKIAIVGIGSGWGAADARAADGPKIIIDKVRKKYPKIPIFYKYYHDSHVDVKERRKTIEYVLSDLYNTIVRLRKEGYFIVALTGDHTYVLAIQSALAVENNDRKLLYIDAHMDAHTPRSSQSKNPHGMPNSTILGYGGYKEWNQYSGSIKPENFYLFGARSFEPAEERFLNKTNANICYMNDLHKTGELDKELRAAIIDSVYSLSIDVDAFDPEYMPGTGYREPGGIHPREVLDFLSYVGKDKKCTLVEITEFNPHKDVHKKTVNWIMRFIDAIFASAREL